MLPSSKPQLKRKFLWEAICVYSWAHPSVPWTAVPWTTLTTPTQVSWLVLMCILVLTHHWSVSFLTLCLIDHGSSQGTQHMDLNTVGKKILNFEQGVFELPGRGKRRYKPRNRSVTTYKWLEIRKINCMCGSCMDPFECALSFMKPDTFRDPSVHIHHWSVMAGGPFPAPPSLLSLSLSNTNPYQAPRAFPGNSALNLFSSH